MSPSTTAGARPILLDLTLPAPEENLALDEAILEDCERSHEDGAPREFLRFWSSPRHFVVLGVSGKLQEEVRVDACLRDGVPVLRRASGGGTVLQGPGCLNYALALSLELRPELRDLRRGYAMILGQIARALEIPGLAPAGISDLAIGDRKVSGNAQKRTRHALLHHGSLLLAMEHELMARWLEEPVKRPEYRGDRSHAHFLTCIPLDEADAKSRLRDAWHAAPAGWSPPPLDRLVQEKYGNPAWTERF
jgi:lipoate-protein ligase A